MSGPGPARPWSEAEFATALEKVVSDGTVEADGLLITREQLAQLVAAAADGSGAARLTEASFRGSTFADGASFAGVRFDGDASFGEARFMGEVSFAGSSFEGDANFGATPKLPDGPATFLGDAVFSGATFSGNAPFGGVTFERDAAFYGATFLGNVSFAGVTVGADAQFGGASFARQADFAQATFSREAHFAHAMFGDGAAFAGVTVGGDAWFEQATFEGDVGFERAAFHGRAVFDASTFSEQLGGQQASFAEATFDGHARFGGVTFAQPATFGDAGFAREADFVGASFLDDGAFERASFAGIARFRDATFMRRARFSQATFERSSDFTLATFIGDAVLAGVAFGGPVELEGATFGEEASFDGSTFAQARQVGPVLVSDTLTFRLAVFAEPVRIEASARRAFLTGAVFRAGADVLLRWADVVADDADFAGPSLLGELPAVAEHAGRAGFIGPERPLGESRVRAPIEAGWVCSLDGSSQQAAPRPLSLRRAKVAQLTISGADLRACRFAGAYGIDHVRLERVRFAHPPRGWQTAGRNWPILWSRRRTLAEEQHWRREHGHGTAWYRVEDGVQAPGWLDGTATAPTGEELAGLYRSLRKGLEDRKDEPGAADFYYGEMEMRRRAEREDAGGERATGLPERTILALYWLTSGYALRPSRALCALLAVVAAFTTALYLYGFEDRSRPYATAAELRSTPATPAEQPFPPSPADVLEGWTSFDAWTYGAGTATAVIGAPDAQLTDAGQGMRIALRVLGPLLIGLALLSIRGRVRR